MMQFREQRALITGGSEGIGKALAAAFVERGARVAIMARRKEPLEKTAKAIGALAIPGDVSIEADTTRAVETTVRELGGLDILINNAAIGYFSPITEIDRTRFDQLIAVNVTGPMLMARAAAPHFMQQKSGTLINISSTAGLKGFAKGTPYVASKFALKGMTECWRDELRRYNVRVVLVNPSEVQTGFGGRGEPSDPDLKKLVSRDVAEAVIGALLLDPRGFIPELSVWATNPF
jgi:3-oxoacyl-[acyl-carrier protein] reductase